MHTVAKLASPISPFFTDRLFMDLNGVTGIEKAESVHLSEFPKADKTLIDKDLEEKMDLAQKISSMVLALRRKVNIKVRQPLQKIIVPILDNSMAAKIDAVKKLILTEVNVKDMEYITDTTGILVKKIKPNFKTLGPKYGKYMKGISQVVGTFTQQDIINMERLGKCSVSVENENIELTLEDVEIMSEDIPGWLVANEGKLTVALDITLTSELVQEGIAREFVNRIQNLRKDSGLDVTDKISIEIVRHDAIYDAINTHKQYIGSQTLALSIEWVDQMTDQSAKMIDIDEDIKTLLKISKIA